MWRWPEDDKTWIIGSGWYGGFVYSTDIGYCRLILYSGLIGFVTFASSFVYYAYYFARKYPRYFWLFLFYLVDDFHCLAEGVDGYLDDLCLLLLVYQPK